MEEKGEIFGQTAKRFFMRLSYRGTHFHGWQRQPGDTSVQQTIEEALSTVMRVPVEITGAGRTDAGVHARCMWAHFDAPEQCALFQNPAHAQRIAVALSRICAPDIYVHEIVPVAPHSHARFDASSRTYKYFLTPSRTPFLEGLTARSVGELDYTSMNRAAALLLTSDDFTSFSKLHTDTKTNICKVTRAEWAPAPGLFMEDADAMVFTITADRFLRNMVRAIVGTLIEVGRGKLSVNAFKAIINAKDRCAAGTSAPAKGLYLWEVEYPASVFNQIRSDNEQH